MTLEKKMNFKRIISSLILTIAFLCTASALEFNDVDGNTRYYDDIWTVSELGPMLGDENGNFNPQMLITRAEIAAVTLRAMGISEQDASSNIYTDVSGHWGERYVMKATDLGILNGVGDNRFAPDDNITYFQLIKILVCATGRKQSAEEQGGWPYGYVKDAYNDMQLIGSSVYNRLMYTDEEGELTVKRGEVARYFRDAFVTVALEHIISTASENYYIGMPFEELGTPDEILTSVKSGDTYYVYGTTHYSPLVVAIVNDGNVVGVGASGKGFDYNGYRFGDTPPKKKTPVSEKIFSSAFNGEKIHSVMVRHPYNGKWIDDEQAVMDESRLIFHLTNAYRVANGMPPYIYKENASKSALINCQNMLANDNGSCISSNVASRLRSCGETVACAAECYVRSSSIHAFDAIDSFLDYESFSTQILDTQNIYTGTAGLASYYLSVFDEPIYRYYFTQEFYR